MVAPLTLFKRRVAWQEGPRIKIGMYFFLHHSLTSELLYRYCIASKIRLLLSGNRAATSAAAVVAVRYFPRRSLPPSRTVVFREKFVRKNLVAAFLSRVCCQHAVSEESKEQTCKLKFRLRELTSCL